MFPESPVSRKIDALLREFRPMKEICATLRVQRAQVAARIARAGYVRHFITADELRLLKERRKL